MLRSDFKKYGIINFTPDEVTATGAALGDVKIELMVAAQAFRSEIGRRVKLIFNGITTGNHKAIEHPQGLAFDGYLYPEDGPVMTHLIFKAALTAGFRGIGIYYNGIAYSFHLDLRPVYGFWGGVKDATKKGDKWRYVPLLAYISQIKIN